MSLVPLTIECSFNYTSAGNRVFELYGASASSTINVANDQPSSPRASIKFILEYYGSNSTYTTTAGINNVDVFSADISSGGIVTAENVDWINGNCAAAGTQNTCTLNSNIFTVAPNCTIGKQSVGEQSITLTSSTMTLTYYNSAGSGGAKTGSYITCQKQGADFVASKTITGTFNEVMTTPGISKPKTCYYAFGGASATLASPTECTTGTCVEVVDTCGTVSPPTWITTAVYRDVTFANGTWANNSPVFCSCVSWDTTSGLPRQCQPFFETANDSWSSNSSGGLIISLQSSVGSVEATGYVQLNCQGTAP